MTDDEKIEAYLLGMLMFHAGYDDANPHAPEVWDGYDDAVREADARDPIYMPECLR